MIRHLVMFSGGVCSWATAKRVVERHGTEGVTLLFADTKMEDEDLYRFLDQAAANVGAPLVKIADGRTPWDIMRDERMMANTKYDPCSRILKRELLEKWRTSHADVNETVTYLGLDWTEQHRLEKVRLRMAPWRVEAPMTEPPYSTKRQMLTWLRCEGLVPPRLYEMGFPHNNCGGFCVKAGQAQFALLLRTMPERYAVHEAQEKALREIVGDHTILRDRRNGQTTPLTLEAFRERVQQQGDFDRHAWGGCGCAVE